MKPLDLEHRHLEWTGGRRHFAEVAVRITPGSGNVTISPDALTAYAGRRKVRPSARRAVYDNAEEGARRALTEARRSDVDITVLRIGADSATTFTDVCLATHDAVLRALSD